MRPARGPGSLQRTIDRGSTHVEVEGDLRGREPEHVAQDEHRTLLGRKQLQRRHHGQAEATSFGGQHRRIIGRATEQAIGKRL
jgi:hypothetical protein